MRTGDDQRAPVLIIHILGDVHGVDERGCFLGDPRHEGALVEVKDLRLAAWIRAIGQEAVADPTGAERFVEEVLDQWAGLNGVWMLLDALNENMALVDEGVDVLAAGRWLRNSSESLPLGLVKQPLKEALALIFCESIFNETETPLDEVTPHLVEIAGGVREVKIFPVRVLASHRRIPVLTGPPGQWLARIGWDQPRVVAEHRGIGFTGMQKILKELFFRGRVLGDGCGCKFTRDRPILIFVRDRFSHYSPICLMARSRMISCEPPPIDITLVSR